MAVHQLTRVIQNLRKAALPNETSLSDGQLLDLFIDSRDESAFAALVQRHGPMVWGVCRRIVAHHQDAEDAFQAAFLVLACKATTIRPREMVANWLFGVAQRTALKARTMARRRYAHEKQVASMPEPQTVEQNCWENLESLIDEELAKLPDKYRSAIVMCGLEGKRGKDVARRLKIPEGTLASRLRTGRVMLAKRLARHGFTLSGGALSTALTQNAVSACVPAGLVPATIKAATLIAAGKTAAAEIISANAAALMEGVMKAMLLTKLKTLLSVLLVLGIVASGGISFRQSAVAQQAQRAEHAGEKPANTAPSQFIAPVKHAIQTKKEKPRLVTYGVADLVVPIEGLDVGPNSKEIWLMKKIIRTVAPSSWVDSGGTGTIQYLPVSMSLVVNNTPRVQAQVKYLLETMRRVQSVEIVAETRLIWINGASYSKVRRLFPQLKTDGHAVLGAGKASTLLFIAQEDADAKVVQVPKITFFPGQRAKLVPDTKTEIKLVALVAANLQHIELNVNATVGKVKFIKAVRLEDDMTLAQVKRDGDDYLVLLITPRVILDSEEEQVVAPPPAAEKHRERRRTDGMPESCQSKPGSRP